MYKITQKKKVGKLFWAILPILMLALMATFFIIPKTQNRQVNAFTSSATEGFVTVGELFNGKDAEYKFSGANLKSLFNKLSENGSGNISTLTSDITTNGNKTAETIRGYNDSNSVVVTLGGLEWIVTYVSKDTDGNVIATLWLTNNEQDAWSGKSQNLGLHYGFANGGLYADWAADWYSSSTSGTYVSAMYGTSYIRSVVLNNGGSYATSTSAVSSYTKSTDGSNPFELFTVPANGLTDYIVAPEKVAWQKTIDGQDKSLVGFTYDCSNNALSNTPASGSSYTTKFYSSAYDYSNKTGYANWGTDKLWLPSITETGYSDTNDGLWETVVAERQNYDGSTTSFTASTLGSSQSNYGTTAYTSSWLRSGDTYFSYFAYVLDPSGGSYGSIFVYRSQAVRPALHLNLTSAALSAAPALDDGNGSISVADLTYTGSTLTPSVTVKYNGTTLTKDTDYTLTYSPTTIKNAGTYDVTATGMGDYEGSISTTFTVNAKSITTAVLSSASEQIYNGEDQTGNIVIEDNGKILQHKVDYDLVILGGVYDEPVMNEVIKDAGEYRITVNGIGNYDDVLSFTFNITAKSIAGVSFSAISAQTYTGSALTPSFTVTDTDRGVALTKTTDYTVGYSNNTNVGTATVTITGAGNYTGSASTTFTINPKSIADVTVSDIPNQTYTGSALTPAITVTDGGTTLNKTTDYTLEYRKDSASGTVVTSIVDVGTYYIKVVGAGNYTSSITKTFVVDAKSIENIEFSTIADETFNNTAIQPSFTVTDADRNATLKSGTDYTVGYSNNTNVGTATITITGTGNYTGTKNTTFTIVARNIENAGFSGLSNITYTGSATQPTFALVDTTCEPNLILENNTHYTYTVKDNTNVGTATVTVTGKGNYTGTKTGTYKITQKDIAGVSFAVDSPIIYTGSALTPSFTVTDTDRSVTLTSGTDYTFEYSNNINTGQGTITITGKGNYTGTASTSFTISPLSITNSTLQLSQTEFAYTGGTLTPTETLVVNNKTLTKDTDYTLEYRQGSSSGTVVTNPSALGTYYVVVTGKGNYTGSVNNSYAIVQDSVSTGTLTLNKSSFIYNKTSQVPIPTLVVGSNTLENNTDYTITYKQDSATGTTVSTPTNAGTYYIVLSGKGNYTGTISKEFVIEKCDITGASITFAETSFVYQGSPVSATVSQIVTNAENGGITVEAGTYNAVCTNNSGAGVATLTVTATGSNYKGSASKTYEISKGTVDSKLYLNVGESVSANGSLMVTYNGTEQLPTVVVKDSKGNVISSADYSVTFMRGSTTTADFTTAGTITITATPKTNTTTNSVNYTGTATGTYTISKYDISQSATVSDIASLEYDGAGKEPTITVYSPLSSTTPLVLGADYTVTYSENVNVGDATVHITFAGNYSGSTSKTFSITARSIANSEISITGISNCTYNRAEQKMVPVVTDGGKNIASTLVENTDYTVVYKRSGVETTDLTSAGTITVEVSGMGNYNSSKTLTYTISKQSIADFEVSPNPIDAQTYTGSAIEPSINKVTWTAKTYDLVKGTEYTVAYSNNTNVTTTAVLTITGSGNYTGTKTLNFTINAKNASTLTIESIENQVYSGSAIEPTVVVKDGAKTLTKGTDYTVAYANNTNAGQATVTITGKGNYTGTKTANFTIDPLSIESGIVGNLSANYTYTSDDIKPVVTLTVDGVTLSLGTDYSVEYDSDCVNVGTKALTITGSGNYTGTIEKSYEITKATLTNDMLSVANSSVTYNGASQQQAVVVTYNKKTVASSAGYSVSYTTNTTDVGTVTITVTGNTNFTGSASITYDIIAKSIANVTISTITAQSYTGSAITPNFTVTDSAINNKELVKDVDYTVSYTNNTNKGTATVTITGKGNYSNLTTKTANFEITPVEITSVTLESTTATYDRKAHQPVVATVKAGNITLKTTEYTVAYTRNGSTATEFISAGDIIVTITTNSDNFVDATTKASATFTIEKAVINSVTLSSTSVVYDTLSHNPQVASVLTENGLTLSSGEYNTAFTRGGATETGFTEAGVILVTVTGDNINFEGSASANFEITQKDISDTAITVSYYYVDASGNYVDANGNASSNKVVFSGNSQNYKGQKLMAELHYEYTSGQTKVLNTTDFSIAYTYSTTQSGTYLTATTFTEIGYYKLVISGQNNYTGNITFNYNVASMAFSLDNFEVSTTSQVYTGESITLTTNDITVKDKVNNITLSSTDFAIDTTSGTNGYSNNINVGTATVYIKSSIAQYDSQVIAVEFAIEALSITEQSFSFATTNTFTYDGTPKQPNLTTATYTYNSKTTNLVKNTHYTLGYSNNVDAGTGIITVTGMGNFKDSVEVNFTISACNLTNVTLENIAAVTYNGTAQKPSINLSYSNMSLVETTDYTVEYQRNSTATTNFTDAGTITVIISGQGNYTGTKSAEYIINPKNISSAKVDAIADVEYNRQSQQIKPVVKDESVSKTLVETADYTLSYSENTTDVGKVVVTINGANNYTGSTTAEYNITQKDISGFTVVYPSDIDSKIYTGSAIEPGVTSITWDSYVLQDSEYTISYANNINVAYDSNNIVAGAILTVTGSGNYKGSIAKTFKINPKNASELTIDAISDQTFTGSELEPEVVVKDGNKTLSLNTDYTVAYADNINKGTATVTITGKGNYTGTNSRTFEITAMSISSGTVAGIETSYNYTGSEIKPVITLSVNGKTLTLDTDYTVTYENDCVNAGAKTLTITGKGNYKDTITKPYTISKVALTNSMLSVASASLEYNGVNQVQEPTVTFNSQALTKGTDYTVVYSADTLNVGTVTITISATDNSNFTGTATITYNIIAKSIANVTIGDIEAVNYNRQAHKPTSFSVTDNGLNASSTLKTLVLDRDYTISYTNNTNAGQATVTITGKGNYSNTTTISKNFTINPVVIDSIELEATEVTYNREEHKPAITAIKAGSLILTSDEYTISYTRDSVNTTDFTNQGVITVTISSKSSNFIDSSSKVSAKLTINKAEIDEVTLSSTSVVFNTLSHTPQVASVITKNGLTLETNEYNIIYSRNSATTEDFVNAGIITVTIESNNENFESTATANFEIIQKELTDSNNIAIRYYFVDENGSFVDEDGAPASTKHYMEDDQTYIGQRISAEIIYTYTENSNKELALDTDYTFVFDNTDLTNVGEITTTITGKGNYKGTITKLYKINPVEFTPTNITVEINSEGLVYTGSNITLDADRITVIDKSNNNIELILNTDFELYIGEITILDGAGDETGVTVNTEKGYYNNINAGKAIVFFKGIGNYSNESANNIKYISAEFTISPRSIENTSEFNFAIPEATRVFNGKAWEPALSTATYNSTNLVLGKDYTISYSNNTNAGQATITINGEGNFTGTRTITFDISKKSISNADVSLAEISNFTYTGEAQKPTITLTYSGLTLSETTDYILSYQRKVNEVWTETDDFTNIGDIQITVTATEGNYTGSRTATYSINYEVLAEMILSSYSVTYDRNAHSPTVTVKNNTGDTVNANEYTVTYQVADANGNYGSETQEAPNFTDVMKVKITATGKGNYAGSVYAEFEILARTITDDMVASISDETYTIEAITPTVTVTYNSTNLTTNEYDVEYSSNTNVGEASVKVTGKGNFAGSVVKTFNITAKNITELTFTESSIANKVYNGTTQSLTTQDVAGVLAFDTYNLILDTDFDISYIQTERVNVNTYNITLNGKGNYTGTVETTFKIVAKNIASADIAVDNINNQTFTGSKIEPTVKLIDTTRESATLVLNTDYTVAYADNINKGTATVTITGSGNYTGSRTTTFVISQLALSSSMISGVESEVVYTGSAIIQSNIKVIDANNNDLTDSCDITYSENINVGTVTITITAKEGANCSGSATVNFEIVQQDITNANNIEISTISDETYRKLAVTPEPTVKDSNIIVNSESKTLEKDVDFEYSYSNNINVGQATVTITGKGNYTGSKSVTFTITPKNITSLNISLTNNSFSYANKEFTPIPNIVWESYNGTDDYNLISGEYTLTYENNKNAGQATITITGNGNYTGSTNINFTITPIEITSVTLKANSATFNGKTQSIEVSSVLASNITLSTSEYELEYQREVNGEFVKMATDDFVSAGVIRVVAKSNSGNFTDNTSPAYAEFTILQKSLSDLDIVIKYYYVNDSNELIDASGNASASKVYFEANTQVYKGKKLAVEIVFASSTLTTDDYSVAYTYSNSLDGVYANAEQFTEVGYYVITAQGLGNYTGSVNFDYSVTPVVFNTENIEIAIDDKVYTGSAIVLNISEIKVKDKVNNIELTANDFTIDTTYGTVGFDNNINASNSASVKIKAIQSGYSGNLIANFTILPRGFETYSTDFEFEVVEGDYTYTGSAHQPKINATFGVTPLTEITDYTLTYEENIDAGNGTVYVTGANNFIGTATLNFTINKRDLSDVTLSTINDAIYDGTEQKPTITLTYAGLTLSENDDYSVSYTKDGQATTDFTSAGSILITITGTGNYEGSKNHTYLIATRMINTVELSISSVMYNREAHTPTITVKDNLGTIIEESVYTLNYYVWNTELGDYNTESVTEITDWTNVVKIKISVTVGENSDYQVSSNAYAEFEILARTITDDMVANLSDAIYTMEAITPAVTVTYNSTNLTTNEYDVEYSSNTNVGEASVKITGKGNFAGSVVKTFNITAKDITELDFNKNNIANKVYNGTTQSLTTQDVAGVLAFDTYNLILDTDFDISYTQTERVDATTYNITLTGKGNYTGTVETTFEIVAKNITHTTITYSNVLDAVYTGSNITPEIVLTDTESDMRLAEGENNDYAVTYDNNINVVWQDGQIQASATITITGNGNYTGSKVINFKITPKSLTDGDITVDEVASATYSGSKITPTPKVTWGNRELTTSEIEYSYGENLNVGEGSVTISAIANGNFAESLTFNFTINPISIENVDVTNISSSLEYNRTEQKQVPTLTFNSEELTENTDYELSYSSELTNAGTVSITITGKGNFAGERVETYTITQKELDANNITIIGFEESVVYTGKEITFNLSVSVTEWNYTLTTDDYSVDYSANTNVGNVTVTFNFSGNYSGAITKNFTITAKALSLDMISTISEQTYTGSKLEPEFDIMYNGINFEKSLFDIVYSSNIEVGTANINIKAKENGNFSGEINANFSITAKLITDLSDFDVVIDGEADGFVYKASAFTPNITIAPKGLQQLMLNTDYAVTYGENINAGTGEIYIEFTKNYTGTVTATFNIAKRNINDDLVVKTSLINFDFDGQAHKQTPSLTFNNALLTDNDYNYEYKRNTEITTNFTDAGTISVVLNGVNNFEGNLILTYTINQKDLSSEDVVVTLLDQNLTYTGSSITPRISVKLGVLELSSTTDYTIGYGENINVSTGGTITITAIENSNYTGSKNITFAIEKKEITEDMIEPIAAVSFTGDAITPDVVIKHNEIQLQLTRDFTAVYSNNTHVGTAEVEITGEGNYTGNVVVTFIISNLVIIENGISNIEITWANGAPDLTYTGSAHTPEFSIKYIKDGNVDLVNNTDYTYEFVNNTNAGEASLIITGINDYSGVVTYNFTIKTYDLSESLFQAINDITYTSKALTPEIIGEFNGSSLVKDTDFAVEYLNNTNVGLATAKITGMGNFTAKSIELKFNITAREITLFNLNANSVTYSGSAYNVEYSVEADGLALTSSDLDISYKDTENNPVSAPNFVNVGSVVFVVTAKGNFAGTLEQTFTITHKNFADEDVVVTGIVNKSYNLGEPLEQDVTITFNSLNLYESEHYTIDYENNINAGQATIIITGMGNYTGNKEINYTIFAISPIVNPIIPSKNYFEGDAVPELQLSSNDTNGTITILEQTILVGENTYNWTFIPEDTTNYVESTGTVVITGIELFVDSVEFDGDYKSVYKAYETFDPNGIVVYAVYNSGKRVEIPQGSYSLSINQGDIVTVENRNISVTALEFYEGTKDVLLTVNPLPVTITFDNYSNLVEKEQSQNITVSIAGELEGYSAGMLIKYIHQETNTESDKITTYGNYTVEVSLSDNNYYIEGNNSVSFFVKLGVIYSENKEAVAVSKTGFKDENITITIESFVDKAQITEVLGKQDDNVQVIYVVKMWKDNELYIPTDEYTIKIKNTGNFDSSDNLVLYLLNDTGSVASKVAFEIKDGYIIVQSNTLGTMALSKNVSNFNAIIWIIIGGVVLLISMFTIILTLMLGKRKRKLKNINTI